MSAHHPDNTQTPSNPYSGGTRSVVVMMRDFFRLEAAGGILLIVASALALIVANTPLFTLYHHVLNEVTFAIGFATQQGWALALEKSLLLWINDGLIATFFFLIGLEVKREFLSGELSSRDRALLPIMAAIGGITVPAIVFWFINRDNPSGLAGWAIPSATDTAFALCVLTLMGSRIPVSLKILLTAIAVIDDIGAILVITLFYSHDLHLGPVYFAVMALVGLFILNRRNVLNLAPYIILSFILWIAVLKTGVHATLAGVIAAMFIPLACKKNPGISPLKTLEHGLHPWVAFFVLPVFGFANAGVNFAALGLGALTDPVTIGIAVALFVGNQIGIFGMIWIVIKAGWSPMPHNATWSQLYGLSAICGIGFTMSLFIGGLAYEDPAMQDIVRLGVLLGSLASAFYGYLVLRYGPTNMRSDWHRRDSDSLRSLMTQQVDFIFGKRKG